MKKSKKKNKLKPYQMIALLCAVAVPVLYIVVIILIAAGTQYAEVMLAVAIGVSMFMMPVMYLVTKYPKDMAETYSNLLNEIEKNKDIHDKKQ